MQCRSISIWILGVVVSLVFSSCRTASPTFSCDRTIYNDSDCIWTLERTNDRHEGNVWFQSGCLLPPGTPPPVDDIPVCPNLENGPCKILPHCSVRITYTYSNAYTGGTWRITDQNGTAKQWTYSNQGARLNECPYINHNGSTGPVYLNEPANGDITLGQCSY